MIAASYGSDAFAMPNATWEPTCTVMQSGSLAQQPFSAQEANGSKPEMQTSPPGNSDMDINPESRLGTGPAQTQVLTSNPACPGPAAAQLASHAGSKAGTGSGVFVDPAERKVNLHASVSSAPPSSSWQPANAPTFREIELRKAAQAEAQVQAQTKAQAHAEIHPHTQAQSPSAAPVTPVVQMRPAATAWQSGGQPGADPDRTQQGFLPPASRGSHRRADQDAVQQGPDSSQMHNQQGFLHQQPAVMSGSTRLSARQSTSGSQTAAARQGHMGYGLSMVSFSQTA